MSGESIGLNLVAVAGLIAGAGWCLIPPVGLKGPGSWQAPGLHTQLWVVVVFVDGLAVVSVLSLGTSGWLVLRVNLGSLCCSGRNSVLVVSAASCRYRQHGSTIR